MIESQWWKVTIQHALGWCESPLCLQSSVPGSLDCSSKLKSLKSLILEAVHGLVLCCPCWIFCQVDTMYTTKIQTAASSSVDCLSHQHWPRLAHGLSDCYLYINSNNSKINICFLSVLWTFVSEIQITCSGSYYNKRIILIEEVILILIGNLILLTEQARFYLNFGVFYKIWIIQFL